MNKDRVKDFMAGVHHEQNQQKEDIVCYCAECKDPIFEGQDMVQCPVFKLGELDYIELAHRSCIPEWSKYDDWKPDESLQI